MSIGSIDTVSGISPGRFAVKVGLRLVVPLLVAAMAVMPATARADIAVAVENPNGRGDVDHFEIYDEVCGREIGSLSLAGRTSGTVNVCGGLDQPGNIRIRYDSDTEWTEYPELHSWSVIQLPDRPRGRSHGPRMQDVD